MKHNKSKVTNFLILAFVTCSIVTTTIISLRNIQNYKVIMKNLNIIERNDKIIKRNDEIIKSNQNNIRKYQKIILDLQNKIQH